MGKNSVVEEESIWRHLAPKKRAFLAAYSGSGNQVEAAKAAGINRNTHYDWMKKDEDYKAAYEESQALVGDMLEREAVRRAKLGSDTLLIFLLKGFKPNKYKERVFTESTSTVSHNDPGRNKLTDKDIDALVAAAERLKKAKQDDNTPVIPHPAAIPGKDSNVLESVN